MSRAERRRQAKQARNRRGAKSAVGGPVDGRSQELLKLLQTGVVAHTSGRLQEAADIYERVLAVAPDHPDANHLLGVVAHQAGQDEVSVELISKAIAANAANADYHCNLGNALRGLGRHGDAVAAYETALEIQPDDAEVLNNLGNAYRRRGDLDSAIDDRTAVGNDFAGFFRRHRRIRRVYFNGGKAATVYRRDVLPQISLSAPYLSHVRLPSTSPAYAAMRFEAKLAAWRNQLCSTADMESSE